MNGKLIIGSCSHLYEVAENWGKLPAGISFGYTHGVCADSKDHVYVFNTSKDAVIVFDQDGNFLTSWGEEFAGGAHGFYLHREADGHEYFYLTDIKRGLMVKTTLTGEVLLRVGKPDRPDLYDDERRYIPTDVCIAPNGDIYIADGYGQYYIHQFNSAGYYIRSWGGRGSEPGQLLEPHGISIKMRGQEPEIYIADRRNHRIQVFTLDGQHKRFIDHNLDLPCSFYFFGEELYIPDLNSRVTILDKHDRLITHLGEDQQAYKQKGWPNLPKTYFRTDKLSSPHAVCVDSNEDVYIVEWISDGRLTKLIRQK
ncbi:MAG: repeat-containing protein [Bacilli bacterium]|nr:repeat-containing protein [Bacilli bacterium]